MVGFVRYGDVTFDSTFLFARDRSQAELRFTRSERALLLLFTRHPRIVLSRNQLLDAVAGTGSDTTDRSIDFLINRLRAKLGDPARHPAMIATQYGEGYVWIADPVRSDTPVDAFLVIGPVHGLERLPPAGPARQFLEHVRHGLDQRTAADQAIVEIHDWRPGAISAPARYSLDVSFYQATDALHCAVVLRDAPNRQILATDRLVFDGEPSARDAADALAGRIQAALWQQLTRRSIGIAAPSDTPLELRMHDASLLLARSDESWIEMGAQLAVARAAQPDDPTVQLMWGLYLHSKLLLGATSADLTPDARNGVETEIESLVFAVLPHLDDNPILMLAAAKLLFFTGRGHEGLAEQLAEQAFAASTAFAASFAILGQIRMGAGAAEQAVELYDHGLEMAEPGSQFEVYLLVLRASALLAAGDRERLEATCARLYAVKPITRLQIGMFVALPEANALPPDMRAMFEQFDFQRAERLVTYLYYIFARLYRRQEHRDNLMRGLIAHAVRRFGPSVVRDEVWRAVPGLAPSAM
jgi:DNA-binding winged helix-turn-helix (wHTH) protein/tetratricopeptide (TPR) repeat protein